MKSASPIWHRLFFLHLHLLLRAEAEATADGASTHCATTPTHAPISIDAKSVATSAIRRVPPCESILDYLEPVRA
jgi:hypothetical protein